MQKKSDTTKVNALIQLSSEYASLIPDSVIAYSLIAFNLAHKTDHTLLKPKTCASYAKWLATSGKDDQAIDLGKKELVLCNKKLEKLNDDKERKSILANKENVLRTIGVAYDFFTKYLES